ncbi:MAG: methionyl-tRNA formyltransferase [Bacteroidales bacterium]
MNKKIVFFGTPEFASAQLENIIQSGFDVVAVVTAPDKPAGRGKKIQQSDVKQTALKHGIEVLQPEKLKDLAFLKQLADLQADVFVVIAFRMLPEQVWQMPLSGTFNLHASLLPAYRGAAPINRAIMNGEKTTGLTTFFIDEKIDEGQIIDQITIEIGDNETAGELHDRMVEIGKPLVINTLQSIFSKSIVPVQQYALWNSNEIIPTAPKIFKQDCIIQWNRPMNEIINQIRGLSPYPAAFTTLSNENGEKLELKIFKAISIEEKINTNSFKLITDHKTYFMIAMDGGCISFLEVQQAGKRAMSISEFLRGTPMNGNWFIQQPNTALQNQ